VAGKGGTGKTTLAAALALVAARRGKRVLCIEVDAKGDLPRALGSTPLGFEPRVVQPHISCLSFHPEDALAEYLKLYFKVPRLARLTPLARVFDFVAGGVPGAKDMLVIGKIAFEEKRLEGSRSAWDLIIVDTEATGHVLPQLNAARSMMELVKGGIILGQVRWIDQILADPQRTLLTICALPEDMPVTEAIELHDRARAETRIAVGACFLNRCFPLTITARQLRPLELAVASAARRRAVSAALGADPHLLLVGARLGQRLGEATQVHLRRLRAQMSCPVLEIPMRAGSRKGLATARMVAGSLARPTT
jgi:anion-transporting  ArsA/GET3 family ATPase